MKVKDFLEKCDKEVFVQIKENNHYVNRGLAKSLLQGLNDVDKDGYRLEKEIYEIGSQIYNANYTLGKQVADIIIMI